MLVLFIELYSYMGDLVSLDQMRSSTTVRLPQYLNVINTLLQWTTWAAWLQHHPDRMLANYITQGLQEGFRIGLSGSLSSVRRASQNMLSAIQNPEVVRDYLVRECMEGRIISPLLLSDFPRIHTSCFGVIPKSLPGKWRLIVDLSAPEGHSVNDGIREDLCLLKYVMVDEAAQAVLELGQGAQLAKVDVRSAYRIIPVHAEDRWLLGMAWSPVCGHHTTFRAALCPKVIQRSGRHN